MHFNSQNTLEFYFNTSVTVMIIFKHKEKYQSGMQKKKVVRHFEAVPTP